VEVVDDELEAVGFVADDAGVDGGGAEEEGAFEAPAVPTK
jgi:hypothetical protein